MELKVIAYARNGHTDKFGIPRQSREESPIVTRIVFEPEYSVVEALRGLEGFSHLWLIWGFSEVVLNSKQVKTRLKPGNNPVNDSMGWSPTVRPPRLGGNKRMGVFATRSPFRPNPIGLSSVKLLKVQCDNVQDTKDFRMELLVSGADLLDGTPIYDIKPYLRFSDSHEDALSGFAEETKDYQLEIVWDEVLLPRKEGEESEYCLGLPGNTKHLPTSVIREIEYILRQDPRPGYQHDASREYKMDYGGYTITFSVNEQTVFVKNIKKTTNSTFL